MANANISLITLANTFFQWMINDNNLANSVNNLRNSNYVKDNGSFVVANGSLQTTSTSGTGLSIGANALISGLLTTNTLITTGQASFGLNVGVTNANSTTTLAGNLIVGVNAVIGNLTVQGSQTIVGNSIYTTDTLILRSSLATSGNGRLIVEQGVNSNAELKYLQSANVWQVAASNANGASNVFTTLITSSNITDNLLTNSISVINVGSANSVTWAYQTALQAYAQANASGGGSNAAAAYNQANAAYTRANTANTQGNNAYTQANSATTTATTALTQVAAAYAKANTVINYLPLAGGTMTGPIIFNLGQTIFRASANSGYLNGQLSETGTTAGCIYSLGGPYVPNGSGPNPLNNLFGVGYTLSSTVMGSSGGISIATNTGAPTGQWGFYVASAGNVPIFLDATNGGGYFATLYASSTVIGLNGVYDGAIRVLSVAENAYGQANLAQTNAVTALNEIVSAYGEANSAYSLASTAYSTALAAGSSASDALVVGENAYAKANTYATPAQSKTASGYVTLPGGIIMQWGTFPADGNNQKTITFSVPFTSPAAVFVFLAGVTGTTQSAGYSTSVTGRQTGIIYSVNSNVPGMWFALGN